MKIIRPDAAAIQGTGLSEKRRTESRDTTFQSLLHKEMTGAQTEKKPAEFGKLAEPMATAPLNMGTRPATALPESVQQGISLFERYAAGLADPEKSLKEIEPLLAELLKLVDDVIASDEKASADPELTKITDELIMNARLEQFRFNRGDYH